MSGAANIFLGNRAIKLALTNILLTPARRPAYEK